MLDFGWALLYYAFATRAVGTAGMPLKQIVPTPPFLFLLPSSRGLYYPRLVLGVTVGLLERKILVMLCDFSCSSVLRFQITALHALPPEKFQHNGHMSLQCDSMRQAQSTCAINRMANMKRELRKESDCVLLLVCCCQSPISETTAAFSVHINLSAP